MKNTLLMLLFCLLPASSLWAGKILESLSFQSRVLNEEVRYSVYLPDDYDASQRRYPVLYLLHGLGDNESGWIQLGNVKEIADKAIESQEAIPMIIVMPDAKKTWYVNTFDQKVRYEDMFFEELIPHIEKTYRTRTESYYRGIAGLSMGGFGSFLYTLHHPDMFGACAPLSAALYSEETVKKRNSAEHNARFAQLFGKGIFTEYWNQNNVLKLLETLEPEKLPTKTRFYIDCGDDDYLLTGNLVAHELMREKKLKHEFRVRDGAHNWTYWRSALPAVLQFMSKAFNRS